MTRSLLLPVLAGLMLTGTGSAPLTGDAFAGTSVFTANGAAYGIVQLPIDDILTNVEFDTAASRGLIVLRGPAGPDQWYWLIKSEGEWIGLGGPGGVERGLSAGMIHVYVMTSPPSPVTLTLQFERQPGRAEYQLAQPLKSRFDDLPFDGLVFQGHQPFEGPSYGGFFVRETRLAPYHSQLAVRWSSGEGIQECVGMGGGVLGLGEPATTLGAINWVSAPATLSYQVVDAGVVTSRRVEGFWLERPPTDPAVPTEVVQPPWWELADIHAFCAERESPQLIRVVTQFLP